MKKRSQASTTVFGRFQSTGTTVRTQGKRDIVAHAEQLSEADNFFVRSDSGFLHSDDNDKLLLLRLTQLHRAFNFNNRFIFFYLDGVRKAFFFSLLSTTYFIGFIE